MSNNILFVVEGKNNEKYIIDNLTKFFIHEGATTSLICAYCAEIYQLYRALDSDPDLDLFMLLKEMKQNREILKSFKSSDFGTIYLFFDYDGHSTLANDEALHKALLLFNDETNLGKLFVSYPMVEALKHYSDTIDFKELKVKAKENIGYKEMAAKTATKELNYFKSYTLETWLQLLELHLKKMNHIVTNNYSLPSEQHAQDVILAHQIQKYISIDETVAVLSSFPIFLLDYYGIAHLPKWFNT
jgi:hypothetical protein